MAASRFDARAVSAGPTRRQACAAVLGVPLLLTGAPVLRAAPARRARLVLAGPPAAVSNPLVRIVEAGLLRDVADQVELTVWKDPDQLRLLVLQGQADFVALPTNVAANLHNKGLPLQLVNVSTWGVLWLVSRDPALRTLADFQGRELLMPFRGDMPDIVFRALAARLGLDAQRDFRLRYVASPLDAMQLLLARRAEHALLAEPAVSIALRKTSTFPLSAVSPRLYRSVDLQQAWGQAWQRAPRIPQAGIAALGAAREDAALLQRLQQAYEQALAWCEAEPDACGAAVAQRMPQLDAAGTADSVRADNSRFVTARQARDELEFFFEQLRAREPGLIGGRLPAASFYGG